MIRRILCTAAVLTSIISMSFADDVYLKNGSKLSGEAFVEGSIVRIELETGEIQVPLDAVEEVVRNQSPQQRKRIEAQRRAATLDRKIRDAEGDAHALFEVALWSEEVGLAEGTRDDLMRMVLGLEQDHAGARQALGHVLYLDTWMPADEASELRARDHQTRMRSQGFVEFEGQWMSAEEAGWSRAVSDLEAEIDRLRAELEQTQSDANHYRNGVASCEKDLATAQSTYGAALASAQSATAQCHSEIGTLESQVSSLQSDVSSLESEVYSLECDVSACKSELSSCESKLP